MGNPEEAAVTVPGWRVSRKLGYALAFLAVTAVVIVGLLTYYVGVMNACAGAGGQNGVTTTTEKPSKTKVLDVRLPTHLTPVSYEVKLVPFIIPDNFTIDGWVSVLMSATTSGSTNITLHSADTEIDHDSVRVAEVTSDGTKVVANVGVTGHDYDKDREFYVTHIDRPLEAGNFYRIRMRFVAKLNDNLKGFYRSQFTNDKGQKEYIAVTQFQATDARRAFPCMDEPALKAKFKVSLGRLPSMTSIANMPAIREGIEASGYPGYVWDDYEESVPMSTYLVAFVVSNFGNEESPKANPADPTFRIWARQNALDQIAYAKDIGPKMLKHFEDYFDVKYPLPKQDMIAIPDFSAGAMENWGLITYRETALLYKDGVSAASNRQRIAIVVSHELAHQWFGNLVTPTWWTDLWLNEGFATYVEYLGVEAVQPQLKLLEQFVVSDLQRVFGLDALTTSHPISIPVKHPDEISEIFDSISYAKGASIIRMMNKFLTEGTFRAGLTNYLNTYKYKAAEQDNLWEQLTLAAHANGTLSPEVTVKMVMDTWTLQMGYPVVTVTRDYNSGSASLSQQRFLLGGGGSTADDHDYAWWIPLNYAVPGGDFANTDPKFWMSDKEKTKSVDGIPAKDVPVIFNVQETGYYRVNYDEANWRMLIKALNEDHTQIHVINRAQLIDDALNLARAGLLDYQIALGVTSYLEKETEYIPWKAALNGMGYLKNMLKRSPAYGDFKKYMEDLIRPIYSKVGFDEKPDDQHLDKLMRSLVVSWACNVVGITDCTNNAVSQWKDWMGKDAPDAEGSNPINVNMKNSVYCTAVAHGGDKEWDFAWDRYQASNVATEKNSLLSSMGCSKQVWLLNRFLNYSLTEGSGVRKADGTTVISRVSHNSVGRSLAFDFVRDKWDRVVEYYGSASFSMSSLMSNVLGNRNTMFDLTEVKRFQSENEETLKTSRRQVAQAVENTEANIGWMSKNYGTIADWLAKLAAAKRNNGRK